MKNIILFGFMGTGKTVIGKALAEMMAMEFVDMDDLIEQREGITISEIFETKGEPYFRRVESKVAEDVSRCSNLVVAAGGGVVLDCQNIKVLESTGTGVCLSSSAEVIYDRVKNQTHRPLLAVDDPLKRIREMLEYRKPFYDRVTHRINTDKLTVGEAVEKIVGIIEKSNS